MAHNSPEWQSSNIEPLFRVLAFLEQGTAELSPELLSTIAASEELITQLLLIDRLLYALAIEPRMVTVLALLTGEETAFKEVKDRISVLLGGDMSVMPPMEYVAKKHLREVFQRTDLVEVAGDEDEYGYVLDSQVGHYAQLLAKLFLGLAIQLQKPLTPLFGEKIGSKYENRPYISRFSMLLFLLLQRTNGVDEVSAQAMSDALEIPGSTVSWGIDGLQKLGLVEVETIDTAEGVRWQEYTASGNIDEALGKLSPANQIARLVLNKFKKKRTLTRQELCEGIHFTEAGINNALRTLKQMGITIETKWASNEQHTRVRLTEAGIDVAEKIYQYLLVIVHEEDKQVIRSMMGKVDLNEAGLVKLLSLYQVAAKRNDPEHSKLAIVEYIQVHPSDEVSAVELAQKFKNYRPLLEQLVAERRLEKITKPDSRVFYTIGSNLIH